MAFDRDAMATDKFEHILHTYSCHGITMSFYWRSRKEWRVYIDGSEHVKTQPPTCSKQWCTKPEDRVACTCNTCLCQHAFTLILNLDLQNNIILWNHRNAWHQIWLWAYVLVCVCYSEPMFWCVCVLLTVYLSHCFSGSYGSHRLAGKICLLRSYQLLSTTFPAWDCVCVCVCE